MKSLSRQLSLGCAIALALLSLGPHATGQVPHLVTQIPDNATRVTLKGNVHPLATSQFSRGPVADSLPMNRILLLLKRSDAQQTAL